MTTVVIFLRDGLVTFYTDMKTGRSEGYESGDLVRVCRCSKAKEEPAIVLGTGGTTDDAKRSARSYWRRVCKLHGHEEVPELFGHPVDKVKAMSQVSMFDDSESEDDSHAVETDMDDICSQPEQESQAVETDMDDICSQPEQESQAVETDMDDMEDIYSQPEHESQDMDDIYSQMQ